MAKRVITFGEIMMRLNPIGYLRLVQSDRFEATYAGGEANVAVSLANYGLDAAYVTKVPAHEVGQCAVNELRRYGVDTQYMIRGGDRLGIYFCEKGASQRASKVIYDRASPMIVGTEIWPKSDEWKDKILLIETSEEKPKPDYVLYYLRNLGAQGILKSIKGIIVGKPQDEMYYEEYKGVFKKIIKEFDCEHLGIIYNVNIGHASPTGLLPLGIEYQIDLDNKAIAFKESGVEI